MPMTDTIAPLRDVESAIDQLTLRSRPDDTPRPSSVAFESLVVGVDGSPTANRALAWTSAIARAYGAKVHLVTALGPPAFDHGLSGHSSPMGGSLSSWQRLMEEERTAAGEILTDAKQRLARDGVDATTAILTGTTAARIAQTAADRGADLVIVGGDVMGTMERLVLGSVTTRVRHEAPCSVLVARTDPPIERVLIGTDGSRYSRSAVATGIRLALALDGEADVVHVVPPPHHGPVQVAKDAYEESRNVFADRDATSAAAHGDDRVRYDVMFGDPVDTLLQRIAVGSYGLVVVGTRGLSGLRSRIAGSVSEPLSRKSPISVLLYKEE